MTVGRGAQGPVALPKQVRSPGAQVVNRVPGVVKTGQAGVGPCALVAMYPLVLATANDSQVSGVCRPLGGE